MAFLAPAVPALTAVGSALTTAAPYIALAGTVYSMRQSMKMANQQAQISNYQAAAAQSGLIERDAERKRRLTKTIGTQRTLYSASGVALEGTPLDVFADTAQEFAFEGFSDRFDTAQNINTYKLQAGFQKRAGEQQAFNSLLDYGMSYAQRG